jgi:hypothetical protein
MITERRKKILKEMIKKNCTYIITDVDGDSYFRIDDEKLVDYMSENIDTIAEIIKNDNFGLDK